MQRENHLVEDDNSIQAGNRLEQGRRRAAAGDRYPGPRMLGDQMIKQARRQNSVANTSRCDKEDSHGKLLYVPRGALQSAQPLL